MTTQENGAARQDSENLHSNAVALTPAEQAALDEAKTPAAGEAAAATTTTAADGAAATTTAAAGTEGAAATGAAATTEAGKTEAAAATDGAAAVVEGAAAAVTPAAATQRGVFVPNVASAAPKDFDAEEKRISEALVALNKQSTDGEIDDEAWESQEATLRTEQRALDRERTRWETKQELAGEMAAQTWVQNRDMFLRQPENAFINRDQATATAWASMMQMAVNEAAVSGKPLGTDWDILEAGAAKLRELMGIKAGAADDTKKPEPAAGAAKPVRDPKLDTVPNTLGAAPAAANLSAKTTAEELAATSIQDVEGHMARLTDDQRDALLRSVPGTFADG